MHRGTQSIDETRNKESEIKAQHHSPKAVVPRILYSQSNRDLFDSSARVRIDLTMALSYDDQSYCKKLSSSGNQIQLVSLNKSYEPIMKSLVMVFPPIKQDAVLPGGILLNTNFLRICSFLLCKHPYKFYLKIVSKKLLRDDL